MAAQAEQDGGGSLLLGGNLRCLHQCEIVGDILFEERVKLRESNRHPLDTDDPCATTLPRESKACDAHGVPMARDRMTPGAVGLAKALMPSTWSPTRVRWLQVSPVLSLWITPGELPMCPPEGSCPYQVAVR